jgi:hypothetical protein
MATTSSMDLVALVREHVAEAHPDVVRSLIVTFVRRSWVPRSMRSAARLTTMRAPSAPIGATGSAAVLRATRLGTQVIWPNSRR